MTPVLRRGPAFHSLPTAQPIPHYIETLNLKDLRTYLKSRKIPSPAEAIETENHLTQGLQTTIRKLNSPKDRAAMQMIEFLIERGIALDSPLEVAFEQISKLSHYLSPKWIQQLLTNAPLVSPLQLGNFLDHNPQVSNAYLVFWVQVQVEAPRQFSIPTTDQALSLERHIPNRVVQTLIELRLFSLIIKINSVFVLKICKEMDAFNMVNDLGNTLLHVAYRRNNIALARWMLKEGNVDCTILNSARLSAFDLRLIFTPFCETLLGDSLRLHHLCQQKGASCVLLAIEELMLKYSREFQSDDRQLENAFELIENQLSGQDIPMPVQTPPNFELSARSLDRQSGAEAAKLKKFSDADGFKTRDAEIEIGGCLNSNHYIPPLIFINPEKSVNWDDYILFNIKDPLPSISERSI